MDMGSDFIGYTTKTDTGWEARIAGFGGVGRGDTELDAVKALARAVRGIRVFSSEDSRTDYYCDVCIGQLAKADCR